VDSIVHDNQIQLQERIKDLAKIQQSIKGDREAFTKIVQAFEWLQIKPVDLPVGDGEIAIYIPRSIFNNDLEGLQEELGDADHMFKTISEVATGESPESSKIRYFSTSDPVFWLAAIPPVAFLTMKLVNSVLDAYEKVVKIRKLKAEIVKLNAEADFAAQFDQHAKTIVEQSVSAFLEYAKTRFLTKHKDKGRANELENSLSLIATTLATKIDNGYRVEARVEMGPKQKGSTDNIQNEAILTINKLNGLTEEELQEFQRISEKARYFERAGEPVLQLSKPQKATRKKSTKKDAT
jgi:hypothetical protein